MVRKTKTQAATAVITHQVKADQLALYEQWLDEIVPAAERYPGHIGAVIIRPTGLGHTVYSIVLHFDTRAHLRFWLASQDRAALIAKAQPMLTEGDQVELRHEPALWFTPQPASAAAPKRWKQVLLTWSALYPLVLGVSLIMGWLAHRYGVFEHDALRIMLTTLTVVVLMIYVVMPRYTRLARPWLMR